MRNKTLSLNRQLLLLTLLTVPLAISKALADSTTVVGNGTPSSCTEDAFTNAIAEGGIITFNCGSSPYTLTVTSQKTISSDTVIDGGNLVTLSGGNTVRILDIESFYNLATPSLTVQNITFANGHTTDVPNTTSVAQGGAAIHRLGGILKVINSNFINNVGPVTGQDVAGGAIYSVGGGGTFIANSIFTANQASNGGAIGSLGSALTVINSQISGNTATGNGGNPGNGGNGGGISIDGVNSYFGVNVNLSGVKILNNQGNAFGGGIFQVAENGGTTTIDKSAFDGNSIPNQSTSFAGGVYLQGPTITMTNSSVSKNSSSSVGGMYVGPSSMLSMTNATVAQNTALRGLGSGLFIDSNVNGTILNSTIASNQASSFGAGIQVGGTNDNLSLGNTIISDNTVNNNSSNCTYKFANLGGNLQYPFDPNSPCSDGTIQSDPLLGALQNNGGPTLTIAPTPNSPAGGRGVNNCPATDQRGQTRHIPCTLGAYELP